MTNGEKYKTAQERAVAFKEFCGSFEECKKGCPLNCEHKYHESWCNYAWIDLFAEEEKPLPCPFCGAELDVSKAVNTKSYGIHCGCGYYAPWKHTKHDAIASHNRVAKAVMESEAN